MTPISDFLRRLPHRIAAPEALLEYDGDVCFDWNAARGVALSASVNETTGLVIWSALVLDLKGHGRFTLPDWPEDWQRAVTFYVEAARETPHD